MAREGGTTHGAKRGGPSYSKPTVRSSYHGCVTQQTCLLWDTADMSVARRSRHVCCATQQTCLLCDKMDMSAVSHSRHVCRGKQLFDTADMPPCDTKPWFCVAAGKGQAVPPWPRHKCPPRHIRDVHYAKPWFCVASGEGLAPPLLQHKTTVVCPKQSIWRLINDLLLDLNTCLTPEAQNWTDLNCRL